jgi:hypothetical protein
MAKRTEAMPGEPRFEETGLAVPDPGLSPVLASEQALETPWDDRVEGDMPDKIPMLKIAYENSKDLPADCPKGSLFCNLTGEVRPTWDVVLMWVATKRAWMHKFGKEGDASPVRCYSEDGYAPAGGVERQPGPCMLRGDKGWAPHCPKAQWTETPSGKEPPACPMQFSMLLWDLTNDLPVLFNVKRKGAASFAVLKSQLKYSARMFADKAAPDVPAYFFVPITIGTKKEGIYFLPTFEIPKDPKKAVLTAKARMIYEISGDLKNAVTRMTVQETTETDAASLGEYGSNGHVS